MFSELKRNLRIVKAEKLFEAQLTDEIKKAVEENKFACICQKADKTDIAVKHFQKSLQILEQIGPVTNIYMNLANIEAQQKRHHEAIQLYKKTIELSPYNHEQQAPLIQFCPKLNSFNAYIDAHTNLACLLTNIDQHEEAYQYLIKAIQLQPDNQIAQTNFGDLLRQLGRQKEAIDHTWKQIEQISDNQYQRPEPINAKLIQPQIFETVNVICMKWGTKYDHDYVNKLYQGIQRYTKMPFNFICVTDNIEGLVEGIQTRELKKGWTGWWGKATLFMNYDYPQGKLVYIDLDMIITGDMAPIFEYNGPFAILKTDEIACEKLNKNGYNSSIMIWNNNIFERVFIELDKNWTNISKFIVRFDFWLEMMIENTDFLQDLYPGLIRDYVQDCKESVPQNTRIVCFPRTPKPHDYTSDWIKEYWVKN